VRVDALRWPTSVVDVTPEWLTAALAERHPGSEVDAVEVLEQNEVTNAHARLRVTYTHRDHAPDTLFCKLPPNDERRDQTRRCPQRESDAASTRTSSSRCASNAAAPECSTGIASSTS